MVEIIIAAVVAIVVGFLIGYFLMQKVLKEREMTIVRYCFGIGCPEKGLEEIGDLFNLTRERVRQIRERCILKLKGSDQAHILAKYLG